MKRILYVMVCAVMFFGFLAVGHAERGDWRGGIRERIHNAKEKIDHGIKRGSLTPKEARRLRRELDGILNRIDRVKSDGRLSPKERESINQDFNRLDRDINREKRDDDRRDDRHEPHRGNK